MHISFKSSLPFCALFLLPAFLFAQPTLPVTDPEVSYKEAKELFMKDQIGLAYPLLKELKAAYPDAGYSNHAYLNEDIQYYYIICELKLLHSIGEKDAVDYISNIKNEPRRQLMSYHLAHYYFLREDFGKTIEYYDLAGYNNISNEQIADAKFEKAYAYFHEKQFANARPLFKEIIQLKDNKNYLPAHYYNGFISYYDKKYSDALESFKIVENSDYYKEVVPYYITEIYYFQGNKEEALRYGESVLNRGGTFYYEKNLKLLLGQLYFEKKNYSSALPLLEYYESNSDKVSKEVQYELSYCYLKNQQTQKAIEGFKKLSNEKDSLGQNSMYLLGTLYLQANDKSNARTAFQYCASNSSNEMQQRISRFNYGKLSYELGFQDIALKELKQYVTDYPQSDYDTEAKEIIVNILASTSNYAEGIAYYNSVAIPTAALQKVYPGLLYGRAIELINDQQLMDADELLTKIVNYSSPGSVLPYACFWRGEIAYQQQRYEDAIRNLNSFLQASVPAQGEASAVSAKYTMGYSWFQKEDYKNALPLFESVVASAPSSGMLKQDAMLRLADCNYILKDFTKAAAIYDEAINGTFPQADYAIYQKAMVVGIKNSNEKIRLLSSLASQYPKSKLLAQADMEIALTYMSDEKFNDAIPYLKKIIASDANAGDRPRALLKLGLAYYNKDDNANALAAYKQLIKKYPQSPEADEALPIIREIYVETGKPDEYLSLMRESGINVSVTEADSLSFSTAYLKYESGDFASATAAFGNYLRQYNAGAYTIDANYYLGLCNRNLKDWNAAVSNFEFVNSKGVSKFYESATLELARIYYFELKDYAGAKKYFGQLRTNAAGVSNKMEASRGLIRSYYQLKDYANANEVAKEILAEKTANTDDKVIAFLVLGKSQQVSNDCPAAIASFKSVASMNKSSWGAEARYETGACYFTAGNYPAAEKAALSVIKETASYDYWVTRSYILLGDIFAKQKDYFNAKATYESVAKNAVIDELKLEAQRKYDLVLSEEKKSSKIGN